MAIILSTPATSAPPAAPVAAARHGETVKKSRGGDAAPPVGRRKVDGRGDAATAMGTATQTAVHAHRRAAIPRARSPMNTPLDRRTRGEIVEICSCETRGF